MRGLGGSNEAARRGAPLRIQLKVKSLIVARYFASQERSGCRTGRVPTYGTAKWVVEQTRVKSLSVIPASSASSR
jgi:hypothetical protein